MLLRPVALALSLTVMGCGGAATRAPIPVPVSSVPVNDVNPLPTTDPNYDPGDLTEEPPYEDPLASPSPSDDPSASPSPSASPTATPTPTPTPTPTATATPEPDDPMGPNFISAFSTVKSGNKLYSPAGIALADGQVYVTDLETSFDLFGDEGAVQRFTPDGAFLGAYKYGVTSKKLPNDMTSVASLGNLVFMGSASNSSLYIYDKLNDIFSTTLINSTSSQIVDLEVFGGRIYAANRNYGNQGGRIHRFHGNGTVDQIEFATSVNPEGLATDGKYLYYTEPGSHVIKSLQADGSAGPSITLEEDDINPGDLAVDAKYGDFFVVDYDTKSIKRFDKDGDYLQTFAAGEIVSPKRIAVTLATLDGNAEQIPLLYVVDGNPTNRVLIFKGKR